MLQHLGSGEQLTFPVTDDDGGLLGVVTMTELGRLARDGPGDSSLVAADLAGPSETVMVDDTLLDAMRRLGVRGASALPVVDGSGRRLLGMVSRSHILAAYERALTGGSSRPQPSRREEQSTITNVR